MSTPRVAGEGTVKVSRYRKGGMWIPADADGGVAPLRGRSLLGQIPRSPVCRAFTQAVALALPCRRAFPIGRSLSWAAAIVLDSWAGARRPELGQSFVYDLGAMRRTDPALVRYQETHAIPLPLEQPRGLAVSPDGCLYVVGDRGLWVGGTDGRFLRHESLAGEPQCVAVRDGNLYVGMIDHVKKSPENGSWTAWPTLGAQARITAVAVGFQQVFVADAGQRTVWRFSLDGTPLGPWNPGEGPEGKFVVPSPHFDVAVSSDGTLWIVDPGRRKVRCYAPDGTRLRTWGESRMTIEGFCGCCNPTDLALGPDGTVFTSEKGLPRVKQYSADGRLLAVVAGAESFAAETVGLDLAVDPTGRVWVLDPRARQVRVWTPKEARP